MYPIPEIIFFLAVFSIIIIFCGVLYHKRFWNPLTFLVLTHFVGNWIQAFLSYFDLIEPHAFYGSIYNFLALRFNFVGLLFLGVGYYLGDRASKIHVLRNTYQIEDIKYLSPVTLEIIYFVMFGTMFLLVPFASLVKFGTFNLFTIFAARSLFVIMALGIRFATNKKNYTTLIIAFFLELFLNFISGDRDQVFYLVIGGTIIYLLFNKLSFRQIFLAALLLLFICSINTFVHATKGMKYATMGERVEAGKRFLREENTKHIFFGSLGSISSEYVQSWFASIWLNPGGEYDCKYGKTYAHAILNIVVPRFMQGRFEQWQAIGIFKEAAYRDIEGQAYEFAASSEAILNFGPWFGAIVFAVMAFFISRSYKRYVMTGNINHFIICLILVILNLRMVRTDSDNFFRLLSLSLLGYWIFTKIFKRYVQTMYFQEEADIEGPENTGDYYLGESVK